MDNVSALASSEQSMSIIILTFYFSRAVKTNIKNGKKNFRKRIFVG